MCLKILKLKNYFENCTTNKRENIKKRREYIVTSEIVELLEINFHDGRKVWVRMKEEGRSKLRERGG